MYVGHLITKGDLFVEQEDKQKVGVRNTNEKRNGAEYGNVMIP